MPTVLSLDLSSNTGWSVLTEDLVVLGSGNLVASDRHTLYPFRLLSLACQIADGVGAVYDVFKPDRVVIEEVNLSRNRFTQKLLDGIHFKVLEVLRSRSEDVSYVSTRTWRSQQGILMSLEDKARNKMVRAGKTRGKVTEKHLAVRKVNELYGMSLIQKDNDIAESILLGRAFICGARIEEGT